MSTWSKYQALGGLEKFGVAMGAAGLIGGAYGAFAAARSEKLKTKSLALQLQHKKDMLLFNEKQNESQAQWLNQVFNKQYQIKTLQMGNRKSKARTSFASRGIQMGVGSTKDVFVSSEVLNAVEKLTMNSNKVRKITNQRLKGAGIGIQADMAGVSASNMFATASTVSPFLNMTSTLMSGVGDFAANKGYGLFDGED